MGPNLKFIVINETDRDIQKKGERERERETDTDRQTDSRGQSGDKLKC